MPEDESDERWPDEATEAEDPSAAHDDIMKRLLNYQRSLREGASPAEAAEAAEVAQSLEVEPELDGPAAPSDLLDLSVSEPETQVEVAGPEPEPAHAPEPEPAPEPTPEPAAEPVAEPAIEAVFETSAESRAELAARVQELEKRLELLGSRVGALRRSFQDMAIAADERLAAMEDEIEQVRSERDET
jgi:hypothetical protein